MKGTGKIGKAINYVMDFSETHQREIKLGLTIAGVVLTGITAAKAGIKANQILKEQKEKVQELELNPDMTDETLAEEKKEITVATVKKMAPVVIPPVVIAGATIWSAVSGYKTATKQLAAITAAYNLSEKALNEYTEKAKELIGDKKAQNIQDEANIATMKDAYDKTGKGQIIDTGKGTVLFFDKVTGQFFRSSWNAIEKAVNRVNSDWLANYFDNEDEAPYSALLEELGLPYNSTAAEVFCFKKDKQTNRKEIKLRHSVGSVVYEDTQESATVIDFFDKPEICNDWLKQYGRT